VGEGRNKPAGDFARLGELVSAALPTSARSDGDDGKKIAQAWTAVVGPEAARNSQPRHLRNGRLVVATSSSAWAQALQDQADEVAARLNERLGTASVRAVMFRPAGWDPCAGRDSPAPLEAAPGDWGRVEAGAEGHDASEPGARSSLSRRRLTEDEAAAVERVRQGAVDPHLGDLIAGAMRAALERRAETED
jgi:hypothetical protein